MVIHKTALCEFVRDTNSLCDTAGKTTSGCIQIKTFSVSDFSKKQVEKELFFDVTTSHRATVD